MLQSIFVTGTDTDVGKTFVCSHLAKIYRKSGANVGVMKPFAAHDKASSAQYNSSDTEILARASGCECTDSEINPVYSEVPASPFTASRTDGLKFDLQDVLASYEKLAERFDAMLVEGMGGIMTPILADYSVADLAKQMRLSVIIVARNRIGSLNHSLLSHMACKNSGVNVAGFVINCLDADGYEPESLAKDIRALTECRILGIVPDVSGMGQDEAQERVQNALDLTALKS